MLESVGDQIPSGDAQVDAVVGAERDRMQTALSPRAAGFGDESARGRMELRDIIQQQAGQIAAMLGADTHDDCMQTAKDARRPMEIFAFGALHALFNAGEQGDEQKSCRQVCRTCLREAMANRRRELQPALSPPNNTRWGGGGVRRKQLCRLTPNVPDRPAAVDDDRLLS